MADWQEPKDNAQRHRRARHSKQTDSAQDVSAQGGVSHKAPSGETKRGAHAAESRPSAQAQAQARSSVRSQAQPRSGAQAQARRQTQARFGTHAAQARTQARPGAQAQVRPGVQAQQPRLRSQAQAQHNIQTRPGEQAAFKSSLEAQAQAYRRSDDGSGYRAVTLPGQKAKQNKGPWRIVFFIALAVFIIAMAILGFITYSYWQGQKTYDELADQVFEIPEDIDSVSLEDIEIDWDTLRAINSDIVGWIYIPDTIVNYPIVQGTDDEHYLYYDFNGELGTGATFGTIFLSAANTGDFSDTNNIIYGHHLNNGSMFACIQDFAREAVFNAHRTVYLLTPEGNYRLRTFSLVLCDATDPIAQLNFSSDEERTEYMQDKIDNSVVSPEGSLPAASDIDHSFAFVTCDSSDDTRRYVLFAYVAETTVSGQHAAGEAESTGEETSDETSDDTSAADEEAAAAVGDASEELAAA